MDIKYLRAVFTGGSYCKTRPLTRQDHGITLQFVHPDLPETYQVHFSNSKENTGTAKTQIATADGVTIPDEYLIPGESVYAWAFLQADGAGRSRCMVEIPVASKPTVTDAPPTPQQRSAIDEAIEALNDGVERAEGAADKAEEATEHYPRIVNGYWQVWDAETQTWSDTGVKAVGEDGAPGRDGAPGQPGRDGQDGAPGVTYTPTVSADGEISWTNDGGLPNPQPRNIMGPAGADGAPGQPGRDGATGPAGKSAYASAQDGGYSGTEAQFETDLAGVGNKQSRITASGLLKGDGAGGVSAATPGTDYVPPSDYAPDSKTAAMTQPVGKDASGKLWTEPDGVTDVQVNGTSIVQGGVANVPKATNSELGVSKPGGTIFGITVNGSGMLAVSCAGVAEMKQQNGGNAYKPIASGYANEAVFYRLAQAAGDTTQSASSNPVGQYTENAKSKISEMLNSPVTVTGTTPTITALPGVRYVCGEVTTLDITLPASGIVDVTFESGSTATVLTIIPPTGVTVRWANGFDPDNLAANTSYEIRVTDGEFGVATLYATSENNSPSFRLICDMTASENTSELLCVADPQGNPFRLKKVFVCLQLVSTGTSSDIKLSGLASANLYVVTLAGLALRTPNTADTQNNYVFMAEFNPGITVGASKFGQWAIIGFPAKGENRNKGDTYTARYSPTDGSWLMPWRNDFGYMTCVKLISVTDNAIGAGSRIQVWGIDA